MRPVDIVDCIRLKNEDFILGYRWATRTITTSVNRYLFEKKDICIPEAQTRDRFILLEISKKKVRLRRKNKLEIPVARMQFEVLVRRGSH